MYFYDDDEEYGEAMEELGEEIAEDEDEESSEEDSEEAGGDSTSADSQNVIDRLNAQKNGENGEGNGDGKGGESGENGHTDGGADKSGDVGLAGQPDAADLAQKAAEAEDIKDAAEAVKENVDPENNNNNNNPENNNSDNDNKKSEDGTDNKPNGNNGNSDSPKSDAPKGDAPKPDAPSAPSGGPDLPATDKTGLSKLDMISAGLRGAQEDGVKGAGKEVAKEAAKEVAKQAAKEAVKQAGLQSLLSSLAATLAPILFWVAVVIVVIILIVGILMFFIAMPGQIVAKIRGLANGIFRSWEALIKGEDVLVSTTQLAGVANYIEKMGYDLKGEGFVTSDKKNISDTVTDLTNPLSINYDESSDLPKDEDELKKKLYLDTEQGVVRRNDTNAVVDINSEPLMAYIISDNQCFIIRNFNTTLENEYGKGGTNVLLAVISAVALVVGIVVAVLLAPVSLVIAVIAGVAAAAGVAGGSYFALKSKSNPNYGRGLIAVYHEGARTGIRSNYYDVKEKGSMALDANTKKLIIVKGWSNGAYTFNVDGWSGRYGMPLEFLLSVHLATQMPDLAIDMATSFETEVEMLLHEVKGELIAGILKEGHNPNTDNDFISYDVISTLGKENQGVGNAIKEWFADAANNVVGFFTGEKPWTDEELEQLGLTSKVMCTLFEMGMPHASSCTCCTHIPHNKAGESAATGCGKNSGSIVDASGNLNSSEFASDGKFAKDHEHTICANCKARVSRVTAALAVTNDRKWESYTPYISKVKNHWFRDVYFVFNNDSSKDGTQESAARNKIVQVDEDYFYETGERWTLYETWQEGEKIPQGFQVGDYKLYETYKTTEKFTRIVNGKEEEYTQEVVKTKDTPSTKSKDEIQKINELIALGKTKDEKGNELSRLVKKPKTQSLKSNTSSSEWSAYALTDATTGTEYPWEKLTVDKDSKGELKDPAIYKNEDPNVPEDILIYYREIRPGDITQIEDGQRTETNSKIKTMFIDNKYYKYDGSLERANQIKWDKMKSTNKVEYYNTANDARNEELIAKVDINKDSLNAFSILENSHTLDADYIYRDFKELIVELNYFDKEDLSDKIQDVMQWPIPDCSSAGWPIRKYQKGETFYGTLINSKADIEFMKNKDIEAAEAILDSLEGETNKKVYGTEEANPTGSISDFVSKAYEVHKTMETDKSQNGGWDYCVLHRRDTCTTADCKRAHCDHAYGHTCSLSRSIQDAVSGKHNSCCATYVSWVLKEIGYGFLSHSANETYEKTKALGFTQITDPNAMQPGDLLFNRSSDGGKTVGHVQILGYNGEWLNAGRVEAMNNAPTAYKADFILGMRPTINGAASIFQGYEPNQDVVAPVTGKIIEQGTVNRENIETGAVETVGFIKIQALDHYITSKKGKQVTERCTTADKEYDPNNTYDPNKKEGYDYFYEEYRGVIDGCVIYMEGFDLLTDETLSDSSATDISKYETNTVYNMTDNLKEAQALWREDAKTAAKPFFKDGKDIYIKEGTKIGKTRKDSKFVASDPKGNGNYIRIILRDLEDSIMENVEDYINVPDSYLFNGSVGTLQNCESIKQELVNSIEQQAGPLEAQYPGIVNILKAISMNESSGGNNASCGDDPMQAVESTGGEAGSSIGGTDASVKAAINALTAAWDKANKYGINDLRVVIQAYNFGSGFVDYVHNQGANAYSKNLAVEFSKIQAEKKGWDSYGDTSYVDPKIYKYLPDLNK